MRISIETPFCLGAVNEIYLDGVLLKLCVMADDVEGIVERYAMSELGVPVCDKETGDPITEVLAGKVQIILNKGWSFKNNRFYIDPVDAGTHWKTPDET